MSTLEHVIEKTKELRKSLVVNYPIKIVLRDGKQLDVIANFKTIEQYGTINKLVHSLFSPLTKVRRIEVTLYNPYTEDSYQEVTYDQELHKWVVSGERAVITYDYSGIEEKDRFYICHKEDFIPCYVGIKQTGSKQKYTIDSESIVRIETVTEDYAEKSRRKSLAYYHRKQKEKRGW